MVDDSVSMKDYVDRVVADQQTAVSAALASAEKAVAVAEENSKNWRDNANEWRGAMTDRERTFMTRKEFYLMLGTGASVLAIVLVIVQFI